MLVIFVATVIITTFIYRVINIWIKDCLNDLRMDPPKIPSYRSRKRNLKDINLSANVSNASEISSDESLSDKERITRNNSVISIDLTEEETEEKDNTSVFDLSTDTDSNISDDFTQSSCMSYVSKMGMFSWPKQGVGSNGDSQRKNQVASKNDTSKPKRNRRERRPRRVPREKLKSDDNQKTNYYNTPASSSIDRQVRKKNIPVEDTPQHEITIAGTKVKLPVKPYPCQIAVMNMLIQGCAREQNCLLESPTGSGKTLALLCGVLAWQESYSEHVKMERQKMVEPTGTLPDFNCHGDGFCTDPDAPTGCSKIDRTSFGASEGLENHLDMDSNDFDDTFEDNKRSKRLKVPKIYYGTRTHKQLAQVVTELARSSYRHKKMSILSSREHTCIQDSTRNKTELCQELLDIEKKTGCPYYNEKNKKDLTNFTQLANYGISMPFDIEDLVELGKQRGLCPYFAARNLAEKAEIVFCPYNYILNPDIRESMQINLKGQVVILDEAHNTEDVCREVGSVNFRADDLLLVITECEALAMQLDGEREMYETIARYIDGLQKFIKSISLEATSNNDDLTSQYWSGSELLQLLDMHGIGASKCVHFVHAAQAAIQDFNNTKEDIRIGILANRKPKKTISRSTKMILQQLTFGLNMISSKQHADDYKACINETFVKNIRKIRDDTWVPSQRRGQQHRLRLLKLMCMNPAVIFAPLAREARSIILASGTLTPTASFQSELGTKFPHILSANHVISSDQVYVKCVPKGPTGVVLRANYQNVNSWKFQDELGKLVLSVCRSVPHGILCFFSSYYMMNTQIKRWESNGCWNEIQRFKRVFIEPRYTGDLAQTMAEYRETIKETSHENNSYPPPLSGAILFAVFRGKVAEGIDFSDNEARCVMSIGIPYPVRKDPEIEMKYMYNDKNSSKGLLKGSEWYTIQAFRALNQAVGRCIRHKNDWGAVLLVDERFQSQSNINNLPKWIRMRWSDDSVGNLVEELEDFVLTKTKGESSK